MIRMKNRVYPVWINFEGDKETFERAKKSILDDLVNSGFAHYDAYEDVVEVVDEDDKGWDGSQRDVPKPASESKPTNTSKGNKSNKMPMDKFASESGVKTDNSNTKTAS